MWTWRVHKGCASAGTDAHISGTVEVRKGHVIDRGVGAQSTRHLVPVLVSEGKSNSRLLQCYDFPLFLAYCTMIDSQQTFRPLTDICLPKLRYLRSPRFLSCTILTHRWHISLCTCRTPLCLCLTSLMYISALQRALGTPSKFSSVPILVADELDSSSTCASQS